MVFRPTWRLHKLYHFDEYLSQENKTDLADRQSPRQNLEGRPMCSLRNKSQFFLVCGRAKTKLGCIPEIRENAIITNKFWVQCCNSCTNKTKLVQSCIHKDLTTRGFQRCISVPRFKLKVKPNASEEEGPFTT